MAMIRVQSKTAKGTRVNKRIATAFAVAAALTVSATAMASKSAARPGSFDAKGTGTLVAQGKLRVFGEIDGTVIVRDRAGDAVVRLGGIRQKPKAVVSGDRTIRVYTLRKVDDAFYAKGDNIRVELRAPDGNVSMSAFGRGTVTRLEGEGTYHLNGGEEQSWSSAIVPVAIKPPPPERRAPAVANEIPTPGATV
jgi:hypothetical protein